MYQRADFEDQTPIEFIFCDYPLLMPSKHVLPAFFDPRSAMFQPYRETGLVKVAQALQRCARGGTAIDIGANVGDTCAILHRHSTLKIVSIDASDFFFPYLAKNIERLFSDRAIARQAFVVANANEAPKGLYHWGGTAKPIDEAFSEHCDAIAIRDLLSMVGDTSLLKVDIDGFDIEVISGIFDDEGNDGAALPRCPIYFEYELASGDVAQIRDRCAKSLSFFDKVARAGYTTAFIWDDPGRFFGRIDLRTNSGMVDAINYMAHLRHRSIYGYDICLVHESDTSFSMELNRLISADSILPLIAVEHAQTDPPLPKIAIDSVYDIVFYDTVGTAYTGLTPSQKGLGGSEFEAILLAEALAASGRRVLVLNNTQEALRHNGVDYANHGESRRVPNCDVLILQRYSAVPAIKARKILISASDIPGSTYDHLGELAVSGQDVTLVAVSEWQKNLFPRSWVRTAIPNMLPDWVYDFRVEPNPRKFVYASAALKGLKETIEAWRELVGADNPQRLELYVCSPGYDSYDAGSLAALGVRFLGSLPFARVAEEISSSAGLFFVNAYTETFCIVAALAEALGRRTHILCASAPGALPATVNSPLLTTDRAKFLDDFRAALAAPDEARWYAEPKDYRASSVAAQWIELLNAPRTAARAPGAKVCLSMIVKNEAHVIERCLRSVKPYIHAWAIADTGSTDGTQDIVRRILADLPGELIERPWVDFATNRNEALDLAKRHGDYALVIDADDTLEADAGFAWPELGAIGYMLEIVDAGSTRYHRTAIPCLDAEWRWQGVLHEALCTPTAVSTPILPGLRILRIHNDGARSQRPAAEKFAQDAQVLERALQAEPGNARYAFYLAQSYRDAGESAKAIEAYARRAAMGGWIEEVYFSRLQIALLKERTQAPHADIAAAYLDAYDCRPTRAEAPCEFARYSRLRQQYAVAREFARIATELPASGDVLFIDHSVHAWRARDEWAVSAYWCGDRELSAKLCRELLADARLPAEHRERVAKNLDFALGKA